MIPNMHNMFWRADDGRVYGSATQTIGTDADANYTAWIAAGGIPLEWPRELDGTQTDAMMQAVLENYGLFVNLKYYTLFARWRKEHGGIVTTAGFPIKTDDRAQAKITGLYAASKEAPTVVTPYHATDNTIHQLDAAGMYQLNADLLTHINNCFAVSADVLAQIEAGTITAREQVDAAFDASMTQAREDWLKK